ncbi:MAG TPA: FAD-dependent oxidoreductase, partial [Rudaea sp.]|nr:FAD-dependent oxidoreductase [Rudaea sp.]
DEDSWKRILPPVEDTGCDAVELNFGCPHGMSERGMGSAVGQVLVVSEAGSDAALLDIRDGRIVINDEYQTSLPHVWAGGDCVDSKHDLTVQAVEDGKRAAASIDRALRQRISRNGGG